MKRLIYTLLLPALLLLPCMVLTSCDDYTDFSNPHILTDDELAEMARQKRIADSLRQVINADAIIEVTVIDYPTTMWGGQLLTLDFTKACEVFELTEDEILSGLHQAPGAPEITGFAIQGTTHADYTNPSNTNNPYWGHWWRLDGDVATSYSEDASRFFVEWNGHYDEEKGQNVDAYFTVGQYPDRCVAGDEFKVIEGLKYKDKRVVWVITYQIIERGEVTGGVVFEQTIDVVMNPRVTYDSDAVDFDINGVMAALGVTEMNGDEVAVIGVNADGSYNQVPTANGGFWYDALGYPCVYPGSFYIEYNGFMDEEGLSYLHVGQMPGELQSGYEASAKLGFMYGDKIAMLTVNLHIVAYDDPETPPAGEPTTDSEINVVIEKPWTDDYANVRFDVRDALREAFKMTTYQIHMAKVNGDLRIYCKDIPEEIPEEMSYTSDVPGYWLDADGNVTTYGNESAVFVCLGSSETELWMYAGNFHDAATCAPDTEVTTTYYICCNGGIVKANITVKIGPA